MEYLVTGGLGFIWSHFINKILTKKNNYILNLDYKSKYSMSKLIDNSHNYEYIKCDISKKNIVEKFNEKPQLQKGWINGGFFVVEPDFLKFIGSKNVMLEKSPIINAVKSRNLVAYKHNGLWYCIDTFQDKKHLDTIIKKKKYSGLLNIK